LRYKKAYEARQRALENQDIIDDETLAQNEKEEKDAE
jgi:hypothetical protein